MLRRWRNERRSRCERFPRLLFSIILGALACSVVLHFHLALRITAAAPDDAKEHPLLRTDGAASVVAAEADAKTKPRPDVSYEVHAFYYPWYCNPKVDGRYMHWNHKILPHWNQQIARRYPTGIHDPDRGDIGASFYPQLGPYSSADPDVIRRHMEMMVAAGVGVAVVSWLPAAKHDDNGPPIAKLLGPLLRSAAEYGVRIAIHMEPYEGRTARTMRKDIEELLVSHGDSPALHRLHRPGREGANRPPLPLLYFYDQYTIGADAWKSLLDDPPASSPLRGGVATTGGESIRGTPYDAVAIALIVEKDHWRQYVGNGPFDGGYTYFAANTFTYGSRPEHWRALQRSATEDDKLFIPSVGPGYDDTRVRPWNAENTKERRNGSYFDDEWKAAIDAGSKIVSVTSFNEWHEGTQIEPAVPKVSDDGWKYKDYEKEGGPTSYLERNKMWVERFAAARGKDH